MTSLPVEKIVKQGSSQTITRGGWTRLLIPTLVFPLLLEASGFSRYISTYDAPLHLDSRERLYRDSALRLGIDSSAATLGLFVGIGLVAQHYRREKNVHQKSARLN